MDIIRLFYWKCIRIAWNWLQTSCQRTVFSFHEGHEGKPEDHENYAIGSTPFVFFGPSFVPFVDEKFSQSEGLIYGAGVRYAYGEYSSPIAANQSRPSAQTNSQK